MNNERRHLTVQQIDKARETYSAAIRCIRTGEYAGFPQHEALLASDLFHAAWCPVRHKAERERIIRAAYERWLSRYGVTGDQIRLDWRLGQ